MSGRITFGNRQEANQNEHILVGSLNVIMHVPNRKVDGVIFMLAGGDGHGRFVASQYNRDENRSVHIGVLGDDVLMGEG